MIAPYSDGSLTRRAMLRPFVQQEHSFVSSVASSFFVSFLTGSFKSQRMTAVHFVQLSEKKQGCRVSELGIQGF